MIERLRIKDEYLAGFDSAYAALSCEGACDCPGSSEWERVRAEWVLAGSPGNIEAFIRHHANDSSKVPVAIDKAHQSRRPKKGVNVVGCLNGGQIYSDNPEYLALLSQVTLESIPLGNYSDGIKRR